MSAPDVLPDSRLKQRPDFGSQVVDWRLPSGETVRIEVVMVYCANCGKEYGYVPRENTSFAFWLCGKCFEKYGAIANTLAEPDEDFRRKVEAEMVERFGRGLSEAEIVYLAERGELGTALEKLERESPYVSRDRRPRG